MKTAIFVSVILMGFSVAAHADIWMWVDANGKTHFVDTQTAIYTWTDESGRAHYSDTPGHEDAIRVELIWYSPGTLDDLEDSGESGSGGYAYPGETAEERHEREQAEAYYCKRATEIYESYLNAPQLYKTSESGEREYLSKEEKARTIAETRARKDELCE
jgi:hypothetical protein